MKPLVFSIDKVDRILLQWMSSIFLFLYIYAPKIKFFPVNITYVVIVFAFGYICYKHNLDRLLKFLSNRVFLAYLLLVLFCVVYIAIIPVFSQYQFNKDFLITYVRLLIDILLVIPVFVLVFHDELELGLVEFLNLLVKIGLVQAVLATIMFVIPSFKSFVFNVLVELPSEKLIDQPYRGYGISDDFYFSSPLFQGLIFVVNSVLFLKTSRKKYLLYYPFILVSMVINARVTVVVIPVFFAVIFYLSFLYDDLRWLQKLSGLVLIFIGFLGLIGAYFLLNPEKMESLIWIVEGIMGGIGALSGNLLESKTIRIMLMGHLHLPQRGLQIIFGEGLVVFGNPSSPVRSDLGYIRYIYYGGLILSAMAYFSIINFSANTIYSSGDNLIKALFLTLLVTLFVVHFKGDILNSSAFLKGFLLLHIFSLSKPKTGTIDAR